MSTFRRYGGLNYSANNNITRSRILNSEQLNINNYSGQQNSKEVFASHVDMSGNSILHTGCIYFQDGTSICTGSGAQGATGAQGDTGPTGGADSYWTGVSGPTGIYYTDGNVGIGTTGPTFNLDVNGSVNFASVYQTVPGATGVPYSQVSYDPYSSLSGLQLTPANTTWVLNTSVTTDLNWFSISLSSSGQYQSAVVNSTSNINGGIWGSTNYGRTWTQINTNPYNWYSISLSSSGQYQSAVVYGGGIYTSTDYGNTWIQNASAPSSTWFSISLSSSGQYQSAVVNAGGIWGSTNYGYTWTPINSNNRNYYSISLSSSGQYQSAVVYGWGILGSTNYGSTWTQINSNTTSWCSISLSSSGQYQSAVANGGGIYTSNNYGNIWPTSPNTSAPSTLNWYSISLSSSGQYQSTVAYGGGIYTSTDYGNTWTQNTSVSSTLNWWSISLSSSGQYQTAVAMNTSLYAGCLYTTNTTMLLGLQGITGGTGGSHNVKEMPTSNTHQVFYITTGQENNKGYLVYNNTTDTGDKTFVIDHPCDKNKYLVHACLEGPEAGVYYRGEGKITNNKNTIIKLPYYVDKLASQLTVNLTPIYDSDTMDNGLELETIILKSSRVKNNAFTVYGPTCEFFWTVYGKRNEINVEPLKRLTDIKGTGPYKWI